VSVRVLDRDGDAVVASDLGPRSDRAVVLLHGFTGDRSTWSPIAERLALRRRVVVPDLPGHGATVVSAVPDMDGTAALLGDGLDLLGVRAATLVGYSMGGRIALHATVQNAMSIDALVLVGASPGIPNDRDRARRRADDDALAASIEQDGVDAFARRWEMLPLFATQSVAVRTRLRAQRATASPTGLAASLRRIGTGAQPWLGDRLAEIACPALLVTGALDDKFTRIADAMARAMPVARHVVIPHAGHAVHYERPDEFVRELEAFLDQQEEYACRSNG